MATVAPFSRKQSGTVPPLQKHAGGPLPKKKWVLRSFVVKRRNDDSVRTYDSVVYTPYEETADWAIGLSPDEVARRKSPSFIDGLGASKKVAPEEMVDFWENLGVTVEGGGTEAAALTRATRMAKTARMRGVLGVLRYRLEKGHALHEGLREFPDIFVKAQVALAEAAIELTPEERAAVYRSLSNTIAEKNSRGRRFLSTMLDQIITGVMLVIVCVVSLVCFAPSYANMFSGMGLELPKPYKIAVTMGQWLSDHGVLALAITTIAAIGAVKLWEASLKAPAVQRMWAKAPIVGPVVRALALANSLPIFAVLHKAGVNPESKFRLSGQASGNALVESFFRDAYARCSAGMPMEQAFLSERLTLGLNEGRRLAGKVEAGGELGNLEGVLGGLAREFAEVANARIEALPKVLKPLNMIVMGTVISGVAALVGLPSMLVLEKTFEQQNKDAKERMIGQQPPAIHAPAVVGQGKR